MIDNPYLSVVSGTWNRFAGLQKMVASVRMSIGIGIPYEIVLVDGGSTDGSLEWMRIQPDVKLIEQGKLLGCVQAFNVGAKAAAGKYVILANDDIEFRYESLQNALAFMDDSPTVGIGCFLQNRHSPEYTLDYIPVVKNGKGERNPYGQVCIIPKWLGDKVAWWSDLYWAYAGDCEMSCRILELGYEVKAMESCCINDFQVEDELRKINNPQDHLRVPSKDSVLWRNRWSKGALFGPIVPRTLSVRSGSKPKRLVYSPIYESDAFPIQTKTKFGLRKYLAERYLVSEVDYRKDLDELYYTISMLQPQVCLFQVHGVREITYDFMMKLKDEFRDTVFVSWNGDYNEKLLHNKDYMLVMKQFDIASFVTAEIAHEYLEYGINYRYWQLGFEEYVQIPKSKEQFDVVFLGNCYSSFRQAMGEMLRYNKNRKTGLFGKWPSHLKTDGQNQYDFAQGDAIYRSSKIAIGDNQFPKSLGYTSNRLFQALHSGVFLLQQNVPGITEFLGLEDGVHLAQWKDLDDLNAKIDYWLAHDEERDEIARAGKVFIDRWHSFKNRVDEFDRMVDEAKMTKLALVNGQV